MVHKCGIVGQSFIHRLLAHLIICCPSVGLVCQWASPQRTTILLNQYNATQLTNTMHFTCVMQSEDAICSLLYCCTQQISRESATATTTNVARYNAMFQFCVHSTIPFLHAHARNESLPACTQQFPNCVHATNPFLHARDNSLPKCTDHALPACTQQILSYVHATIAFLRARLTKKVFKTKEEKKERYPSDIHLIPIEGAFLRTNSFILQSVDETISAFYDRPLLEI